MKIAIDFRLAASSNRGMARYCREIVKELMKLDSNNSYYLIVDEIPENVELKNNFQYILIRKTNFIFGEQFFIPQIARKLNVNILWCPYNTFPIFLSKKIKLFVTIHDLIFMEKKSERDSLYRDIGRLYRKFVVGLFSKKIDTFFTVSEYTLKDVEKQLRIKNKGIITPNCLSTEFVDLVKKVDSNEKSDYYFTVSGDGASKNLSFLITCFTKYFPNEKLYIAGLPNNSVLRYSASSNIVFLPANISDLLLIEYYSKCKAFLFPSLKEGFGIPLIEALCCKAKVLSSNTSCMPEILNGQGLLFDPRDELSLVNAIKKIPDVEFTYEVSKYITWKNPAEKIKNAFEG